MERVDRNAFGPGRVAVNALHRQVTAGVSRGGKRAAQAARAQIRLAIQ